MFYTNCDPQQPFSSIVQQSNRHNIHLYDQLHDVELDHDMDSHMARVAAILGTTKHQAGQTFIIKYMLDRLPAFKELAVRLGHLDRQHLSAVTDTLFTGVKDELLAELDEKLTEYLTPTRAHQALPSARRIKNKIKEWMVAIDPSWGAEKPPSQEHLAFRHDDDGTRVEGEFSATSGRLLHDIVRAAAEKDGVSMAQALINLVTGQTRVQVNYNIFGTANGTFLSGIGWLNASQKEHWLAQVTRTRDVTNAHWDRTDRYRPTDAMKAYVRGRDGCCRFPNCSVPAEQCDIDHVVPYPEGPTTPMNLQAVCRHHHNMKTDGRVTAYMDENGTVTWEFPDGTIVTAEAEGPLATAATTWGTTLHQWLEKRMA